MKTITLLKNNMLNWCKNSSALFLLFVSLYGIKVSPTNVKIEHSYETFCKLKWYKAKKQLPLIHVEIFWVFSDPQNNLSLRLFWYLRGHILLVEA